MQKCSFQLSWVVIHDGVSFSASILNLLICASFCGVIHTRIHVSLHTWHRTHVEITEQVVLPSCYHIVFGDETWVIRLDSKDHYLPSQLSSPCVWAFQSCSCLWNNCSLVCKHNKLNWFTQLDLYKIIYFVHQKYPILVNRTLFTFLNNMIISLHTYFSSIS